MKKTEKISILLCEHDASFGLLLSEFLQAKGYAVTLTDNGEVAWQYFLHGEYDLCILEVDTPQKNGFELAADIRETSDIPIFFFSDKNQPADVLAAYKAGADDYLCKPCSMEIVIYKIASIMRRIKKKSEIEQTEFQLGSVHFDANKQILASEDHLQHLSSRENDLLLLLAQNSNSLMERSYILKTIWKNDSYFCTRSLSVYINHLRKHLSIEPNVRIMSVHGKGYKLVTPA